MMLLLVAAAAATATLTDEMWLAAKPVYTKTLQHAFLTGLADGTLPRASFDYYIAEDAKYLRAFGQALSVLASKAPRQEWSITLNRHATEAIEGEAQLHQSLLRGKRPAGAMAPTNYAYTNHFMNAVERGTFAEGLAAMLPCYWIYWEVGRHLEKRGSRNKDYQRWIDQYASQSYGKTVRQVLDMMNAEGARLTAEQRQRAVELFVIGARYEYMFWDMAWRRERWQPE